MKQVCHGRPRLSKYPAVMSVASSVPSDPKDPIAIERLNLMNMAKLSIKGLIESALNLGRTLDSDYAPLQQFFVVMEHCLKHGLKSNTHISAPHKLLRSEVRPRTTSDVS